MVCIKNCALGTWFPDGEKTYSGPSLREAKLAMAQDLAGLRDGPVAFFFGILKSGRDYCRVPCDAEGFKNG